MTEEQVFEHLTPIFRDVFDDDDLIPTAETTAADVPEWDSLSHIRLIVSVEQHFKIKFTTAEVSSFVNVGHFVRTIHAKVLAHG
ncbi:MAG: acyl carrier protein [Rhodocyclales bacterium]|nr:acyl carrier protein [Rhodocyclales bacterium]